MAYYDDDYFIDFEDPVPDKRGSRRRQTDGRAYRDNLSYRDRTDDRPSRRASYNDYSDLENFDSFAHRTSGHQTRANRNVYDRSSARPSRRGDTQQGSRRQPSKNRKPRFSRRFRRTMIVTVFILIVLLLLTGIISIAVSVSGVGEVDSLTASQVASDKIELMWERAAHADGYRVMLAQGGSDSFEEYTTVTDPDTLSVTVSDLEQASSYSFSVIALRGKKESKPVLLDSVTTLPSQPEITNIFSADIGTIHVDWSENKKASGYIVEYKKEGAEYSAEATLTLSDPAQCSADITDLEVKTEYMVRVTSFISADKQLRSLPSDEVKAEVAEEKTEITPKAKEQKVDESIDPDKPMIAFTFDDGPAAEGDSGERILDVLEQYDSKATFFMVGCNTGSAPDNLKRKVSLGMEIGNHTWNHTHYGSEVTPEDISKASSEIYNVCGQYPTCFRSPGGMTTNTILTECAAEGMSAYYWSIDTQDWKSRDADAVYHSVMDHVKDGDIVLMHELYGSTADAVERMVPELIEQGYQLVTCHDLITCKTGSDPVPGVQYVDAFRELAPS